jgi:hypothetical protein
MPAIEITLISNQKNSLKVPEILEQVKKEFGGVSYSVGDSYSFGPAFDETTVKIILTIAQLSTPLVIALLQSLFKKLGKNDIRTEYRDRYKLATEMLSDKAPLICDQMQDSPYFSQYIFKTKYGEFIWEYNKGNVSLREK